MALYRYVKAAPKRPVSRPVVISYLLMSLGVFIILWTVWPIASFFIFDQVVLAKTVSPLSDPGGLTAGSPVASAVGTQTTTDPNTWFPTRPQKNTTAPVNSYILSIPSLDITDATVIISGDDLAKSLIHYGGTGLPGEYGNTVIFGHSTLPQFFRGTRDYKSIFSTLPTIKIGANIHITYDGVEYRYVATEKVVVEPTDLSPLEQRFDDSYLTLVTCVPPGTYLYRLNVKAKLIRI
ncbi:MAG TPA: sortase [Patescibacteria group bacterium]|nr:sortase [Patescibacteria group bacterium]